MLALIAPFDIMYEVGNSITVKYNCPFFVAKNTQEKEDTLIVEANLSLVDFQILNY